MRKFDSGATRDDDNGKLDYEGFLSPLALQRYAEYMHAHRRQADGEMRNSDNWQRGIPQDIYVKSMFRHFLDSWAIHRGYEVKDKKDGHIVTLHEALCGVIFNAFGIIHEDCRKRAIAHALPAVAEAACEEHTCNHPHGVISCDKCPDNYACAGMDEEELIWKDAGASPEQLYWRRMTIENKCHGDVDQFNQEYPITPDVAFLASGRPAIDPAIVKHHRTQIVMPDRARLVDDERYERGVRIEFGRFMDSQGGWNIYEEPMEGADYTIGVDTCTGVPSNPTDKFSKPDSHAIVVLRRDPKRIAAVHRSRMDADRLGQEALRAGKFYLMAWVAPEIANGSGMTVLNVLRDAGYLRVYHREAQGDSVNLEEVHKLGWKTTRNTRDWLIDDWLATCRKDPSLGWDFTMQVPDAMLVEEESTFVWNVDKREHKAGCHDDILFAAMIALQLDKRCCRTHSFNRIGEQKFNPFDGPMWMNGRDPGIPELQPDYNLRHVEYLS